MAASLSDLHILPYSRTRIIEDYPRLEVPIDLTTPWLTITQMRLSSHPNKGGRYCRNHTLILSFDVNEHPGYSAMVEDIDKPAIAAPKHTKDVYARKLSRTLRMRLRYFGENSDYDLVNRMEGEDFPKSGRRRSIKVQNAENGPIVVRVGDKVQCDYSISGYGAKGRFLAVDYKSWRFQSCDEKVKPKNLEPAET